jgi:hypothetical protein
MIAVGWFVVGFAAGVVVVSVAVVAAVWCAYLSAGKGCDD